MSAPSPTQPNTEVYQIEKKHVSEITPEEFETKYINRAIPLILDGLLETWPAFETWNTEYFRENLGSEEVQVAFDKEWKTMNLGAYVDSYPEYEEAYASCGRPSPYLRTWNYSDDHPEFEAMFDTSAYFRDLFKKFPKGMRPPFSWLFLGPKGEPSLPPAGGARHERHEWCHPPNPLSPPLLFPLCFCPPHPPPLAQVSRRTYTKIFGTRTLGSLSWKEARNS